MCIFTFFNSFSMDSGAAQKLEDAIRKSNEYKRAYDILNEECELGKPLAQIFLWPGLLYYQYQADKYDNIAENLKK